MESSSEELSNSDRETAPTCTSKAVTPLEEEVSPPDAACEKLIRKMGLEKGSLRRLVMKTIQQKEGPRSMPDPAEGYEEDSVVLNPTPAMLEILAEESEDKREELSQKGIGISKLMNHIKCAKDEAVASSLAREVELATVLRKRRKSASNVDINSIRRAAAEKQYQRMLSGQVGGCVNAMKWKDRKNVMNEVRQSLGLALSILIVFAASYLMGFHAAEYFLEIRDFHSKLLAGAITAAIGGICEALLVAIAFARSDVAACKLK